MSNESKLNKEELYAYFENDFKPSDLTDVFECSESYIGKYYTEWRKEKGLSASKEREVKEQEAFGYFEQGISRYDIAAKMNIHTSSVYRYFANWEAQNPEEATKYKKHFKKEADKSRTEGVVKANKSRPKEPSPPKHILKKRKKAIELLHKGVSVAEVKKEVGATFADMERYVTAYNKEIGKTLHKDPEAQRRKKKAFQLFDQGESGAEVARQLNISTSRASHFGQEYIELKLLGELQEFYDSIPDSDTQKQEVKTDTLPTQLNMMTQIKTIASGDIVNIYNHVESERIQFGVKEQGRPAVVLEVLQKEPYSVKVALITKEVKDLDNPCHVLVKASCLNTHCVILLEQLKEVNEAFFSPLGRLSQEDYLKLTRTLEFFESRIAFPSDTTQPEASVSEENAIVVVEDTNNTEDAPETILEDSEAIIEEEAIPNPTAEILPVSLPPDTPKKRRGFRVREVDGEYASYSLKDNHIVITFGEQQILVSQEELQSFVEEFPDILKFLLT